MNESQKKTLSRREVSKQTGLSERTIQNLTAPNGPLPCVRIGRRVLYRPSDLEAFLQARSTASVEPRTEGAK